MTNNKFVYYYRLRPPSMGTQPSKGLLEMTGDDILHNNRTYWGTCIYDRELTKNELYDYDLDK